MSQPTCCKRPAWVSEADLGSASGFEFILGRCSACGTVWMNVFCVATGITGFEPVTPGDLERMRSASTGPELKALMREWGDANL